MGKHSFSLFGRHRSGSDDDAARDTVEESPTPSDAGGVEPDTSDDGGEPKPETALGEVVKEPAKETEVEVDTEYTGESAGVTGEEVAPVDEPGEESADEATGGEPADEPADEPDDEPGDEPGEEPGDEAAEGATVPAFEDEHGSSPLPTTGFGAIVSRLGLENARKQLIMDGEGHDEIDKAISEFDSMFGVDTDAMRAGEVTHSGTDGTDESITADGDLDKVVENPFTDGDGDGDGDDDTDDIFNVKSDPFDRTTHTYNLFGSDHEDRDEPEYESDSTAVGDLYDVSPDSDSADTPTHATDVTGEPDEEETDADHLLGSLFAAGASVGATDAAADDGIGDVPSTERPTDIFAEPADHAAIYADNDAVSGRFADFPETYDDDDDEDYSGAVSGAALASSEPAKKPLLRRPLVIGAGIIGLAGVLTAFASFFTFFNDQVEKQGENGDPDVTNTEEADSTNLGTATDVPVPGVNPTELRESIAPTTSQTPTETESETGEPTEVTVTRTADPRPSGNTPGGSGETVITTIIEEPGGNGGDVGGGGDDTIVEEPVTPGGEGNAPAPVPEIAGDTPVEAGDNAVDAGGGDPLTGNWGR